MYIPEFYCGVGLTLILEGLIFYIAILISGLAGKGGSNGKENDKETEGERKP